MAHPATAAGLALVHAALARAGAPDPWFERLLVEALAHPATAAVRRPIFRKMELRWVAALLADSGQPDCAELIGARLCAAPGEASEWDVGMTYAFTHELFYLTDFGRFPPPQPLDRIRLAQAADEALITQVGLNDLDLLAELLIARGSSEAAASPVVRLAEALLLETWRDHGFLPGPHFDVEAFETLGLELRPHYAALGLPYHLCGRRGRAVGDRLAG